MSLVVRVHWGGGGVAGGDRSWRPLIYINYLTPKLEWFYLQLAGCVTHAELNMLLDVAGDGWHVLARGLEDHGVAGFPIPRALLRRRCEELSRPSGSARTPLALQPRPRRELAVEVTCLPLINLGEVLLLCSMNNHDKFVLKMFFAGEMRLGWMFLKM